MQRMKGRQEEIIFETITLIAKRNNTFAED